SYFLKAGYWRRKSEIVNDRKVLVEVWKKQDGQFQVTPIHFQSCFLKITQLLLVLDLGLDDVRSRDFTSSLQFTADVQKSLRFGHGLLGCRVLALGDNVSVIGLHDCDNQTTGRNFGLGLSQSLRRARSPVFGENPRRKILAHVSLGYIFMDRVISYENGFIAAPAISLRIEIPHVVVNAGEQGGAALHPILLRQSQVSECGLQLRTVRLGALQC